MIDFNFQEAACKIYGILLESPESRDSDRELLSRIWKTEMNEIGGSFLDNFQKGILSNPETICRMRRKLQEVHPTLRGEKWDVRHGMESVVCSQLTFFDRW